MKISGVPMERTCPIFFTAIMPATLTAEWLASLLQKRSGNKCLPNLLQLAILTAQVQERGQRKEKHTPCSLLHSPPPLTYCTEEREQACFSSDRSRLLHLAGSCSGWYKWRRPGIVCVLHQD